MATITKVNLEALATGVWIKQYNSDGEEYWVCTKGLPDAYQNMRSALQRKAATGFGGDTSKLPSELVRASNCNALSKTSIIGITDAEDGNGPITIDRLHEILKDPALRLEYAEIVEGCFSASRLAQEGIDHTAEYLAKNSVPSSVTS